VRRVRVSSSVIASVGYAVRNQILEIEFVSGRIYQYLDVERETYEALLKAPSKGRYFNDHIRDDYACVRLT
jgi:hypothetical protein